MIVNEDVFEESLEEALDHSAAIADYIHTLEKRVDDQLMSVLRGQADTTLDGLARLRKVMKSAVDQTVDL